MIKDDSKNRIIFVDDDEMLDFCVIPDFKLVKNEETGKEYYDWFYTDDYIDAQAANTQFFIRDKNSKILKDKLIGYRGCTRPIDNVYYDFDWEMENVEKRVKQQKKEEKNKLKAQIEKHIEP